MKIRFDFVTNSSSSSFVTFGVISKELESFIEELENNGQLDYWNDGGIRGPEACSSIDYMGEVINITRDVFEMSIRPKNLTAFELEGFEYTNESDRVSDQKKIMKPAYLYGAIKECVNGLTEEQERALKTIINDAFDNNKVACKMYSDNTDGFCGRDVSSIDILSASGNQGESNKKGNDNTVEARYEILIQNMIDSLNKIAVDPEEADFNYKTIFASYYYNKAFEIFPYDSERYKSINEKYIDFCKQSSGHQMLREYEKNMYWRTFLSKYYTHLFEGLNTLPREGFSISSIYDYAIVPKRIENYMLKGNYDNYRADHLKEFLEYLEHIYDGIERSNVTRCKNDKFPPIKVIWEEDMHNYFLKHTSLGGYEDKVFVGPKGTKRLDVPKGYERIIEGIITTVIAAWPNRIINRKTATFSRVEDDANKCCEAIGYNNLEEFFDAYGFSLGKEVQKKKANDNVALNNNYEYEISRSGIKITKYIGDETIVQIPETIDGIAVSTIGKEAFCQNNSIEEVFVPDSVKTINGKAFAFCKKLRKIRLSNQLSKLVKDTFSHCTALEEVNIPDNVKTLEDKTFIHSPLNSLHIGKSLEWISGDALYMGEYRMDISHEKVRHIVTKGNCIEKVTIDPDNKKLKIIDSMILSTDGKILFTMFGNDNKCVVPEGVAVINDYAFRTKDTLKEVILPESLTVIGNGAFETTCISKVICPPNLKEIGNYTFRNCHDLKKIEFNDGLEKIDERAFEWCDGLTSVIIPKTVKLLGYECFSSRINIEPSKWRSVIRKWGRERSPFSEVDIKKTVEELYK